MSDEKDHSGDEVEDSDEESEDTSLNNQDVLQKYKLAAQFANQALDAVVKAIAVGKQTVELCELGDKTINDLVATVYNKKKGDEKVEKGVAFPTCVSVNSHVCHSSPLPEDTTDLKDGDVVRIDLGVHVDGYPAVVAHTVVVQAEAAPLTGKLADLITCAQYCLDTAVHGLRPEGVNNQHITEVWGKLAEAYGVNFCEGILSHEIKRFTVDGPGSIIGKASVENKVEDVKFEVGQVWGIDVVLSSGSGKLRAETAKTTIYKRAEQQYMLKTQAGRATLKDINARFHSFPFTVRSLEKRGRLGVAEALKHELLHQYPVLCEKPGDTVVHFKTTVLVTPSAIEKVTGIPTQSAKSETKLAVPEARKLLDTSLKLKASGKKKKKKSGAKKEGDGATAAPATAATATPAAAAPAPQAKTASAPQPQPQAKAAPAAKAASPAKAAPAK